MDIVERLKIEDRLRNKGAARVSKYRFTCNDGLVYAEPSVDGFENPMTFDTFTHLCLEAIDYAERNKKRRG